MDEKTLQNLQSGTDSQLCDVLTTFYQQNQSLFSFPNMTEKLREGFVTKVQQILKKPESSNECVILCLKVLRLLSREREGLQAMAENELIDMLLSYAGIKSYCTDAEDPGHSVQEDVEKMVEAQKCLCNLIYNSPQVQQLCCENTCVDGIIQRLKTYKDPHLPFEIKFFDMRMLFLLTALCKDTRPKIQHGMHGMAYLVEVIDLTLSASEDRGSGLTGQEVDLCCEVLKILFNLTTTVEKNNLDEEEEGHFMRLVSVLRDLLVCPTQSADKQHELHSFTVNLLTNMPRDCYEELLIPATDVTAGSIENKDMEFDGKNMEAIAVLLEFLQIRITKPSKSLKDSLTPILHCLCETCRSTRVIRKFCRLKILPFMKDEVKQLPEDGDSIRNRLCSLLTATNVDTITKELAADFLFVLCKESVSRMVKYTGYGNCAGLLSNRGLLFGGRGKGGDYSSDSEDSETDEYRALRDKINPITGQIEDEKPTPMEGMTDEQKEEEAMKLVEMMDRLQRGGIIQPCVIGDDGRPQPVAHVLEFTEGFPEPSQKDRDSVSD